MVVALIALFVALGGSSYAVVTLSKNSVRSIHIKDGQVKRSDLRKSAVDSAKVKNGSLLSTDFKSGQGGPKGDPGTPGLPGPRGLPGSPGPAGAPPPVEGWHEVGAAGEPTFGGNWRNESLKRTTVAFYKDPFGVVHLKGYAANGTVVDTAPIFTLPPGYEPAENTPFGTPSCGGGLSVYVNGAVTPSGTISACPLNGWTFRAG